MPHLAPCCVIDSDGSAKVIVRQERHHGKNPHMQYVSLTEWTVWECLNSASLTCW